MFSCTIQTMIEVICERKSRHDRTVIGNKARCTIRGKRRRTAQSRWMSSQIRPSSWSKSMREPSEQNFRSSPTSSVCVEALDLTGR